MSANPSLVTVLGEWSLDPSVLLGVALSVIVYVSGLRELARRGRLQRSVAPRHIAYFGLGLLCILLALESPIDALSDQLLTMHMVQHLLLLMIAPPLLLLGKPIPVLVVGAPHALVRWIARGHARNSWFHGLTGLLISPAFAWFAFVGAMLVWHLPALYDAALRSAGVHLTEHLFFLLTGLLFWWVVIQPLPGRPRLAHGWRLLYVLAAMLPDTGLGMLLLLWGTPFYPFYSALPRLWGVSVLDDQALAGNIMMVGGDIVLAVALIPLFAGMMDRLEQKELARGAREIAQR